MAAGKGKVSAQYNLGILYIKGNGVLQYKVMAYMYFNVAGANGNKSGVAIRNDISNSVSF